jgi:CDP-4-dehydro-6-deoxyglucose reductase, E1
MKFHYGNFGGDVSQQDFSDDFKAELREKFYAPEAFDIRSPKIRLSEPTFADDDLLEAIAVMCSTRVTMGKRVADFENAFASVHGATHGVSSNSGSSANLLAIAALCSPLFGTSLRPGDEVIVPAVSWSTTVWPIVQHGLIPVVVDVDPETLNIDPAELKAAITERTRAIMPVHVYGNPCDMDTILNLCREKGLFLIEDCCEALGATYKDKPVGSFGEMGTFSFYYSHHISTFEGGITITSNEELAEIATIRRAHGWVRDLPKPEKFESQYTGIDPRFLFVDTGYNLRITEVQGAIGLSQLTKLNEFVAARRSTTERLEAALENHPSLKFQLRNPSGNSSCFGFALLAPDSQARNKLAQYLTQSGIENRPIICGNIARQPAMKHIKHRTVGTLENSDRIMTCGLSVGNHHAISDEAVEYMIDVLMKFR